MNMQDVTNLAILEGDVRTIHDSSNNLLWGKLSYDTKYAGDTFQQTYSGKNLCGIPNQTFTHVNVSVTIQDGEITLNGTANASATYNIQPISTATLNGTYTTSLIYVSGNISNTSQSNLNVRYSDTTSIVSGTQAAIQNNNNYRTWSVENSDVIFGLYLSSGTVYDNVKFKCQIVAGSSPDYSYEAYTGGIPAPNPDYPQAVQTVTGEQTVTVGDGVNSESFTVDLGSIELCKIGDKQDYIYKSGDDWYVHKVIQKVLVDGVNIKATSYHNVNGGVNGFRIKVDSVGNLGYADVLSDNFNYITWGTYQSSNRKYGETTTNITAAPDTIYVTQPNSATGTTLDSTGVTNMNTWFSNHNTLFYYVLATPTDTKITDNTLIGQLEAVHEWLTRYGYNSTVSGTLPLIIEQTNLS